MISIHWGRIHGNDYPPGKLVIKYSIFADIKIPASEYCSFTLVFISIFTLTSRTQHRGAKPFRR
jgi:hypothetical protein